MNELFILKCQNYLLIIKSKVQKQGGSGSPTEIPISLIQGLIKLAVVVVVSHVIVN